MNCSHVAATATVFKAKCVKNVSIHNGFPSGWLEAAEVTDTTELPSVDPQIKQTHVLMYIVLRPHML